MKWIVFVNLFVVTPFSYSEDSVHTRLVLGGVAGCSYCADLDLKSLKLDFDPGLLTDQSVQVVLTKDGVAGYMIRGRLTDKGFVITLFEGLSNGLKKDSSLKISIRTDLGRTISDQVSIKYIHTVGRHDIVFLEPSISCREERNARCMEICEDIYGGVSRSRKICENLPYSVVQSLWEIHEVFESPRKEDLDLMDPLAFSLYMKIGVKHLADLIESEYSTSNIRTVLFWLARGPFDAKDLSDRVLKERISPDVNELFQADEHFKILKALLKQIMFSDEDAKYLLLQNRPYVEYFRYTPEEFLNRLLDTEKQFLWHRFFALITENNNEKAGQWVHRFIEERECEADSVKVGKRCAFSTYCVLSETMNEEVAQKLMGFQYFQKFLDEVIAEKINKPQWSWPAFESHKGLNLWPRDLCGYPITKRGFYQNFFRQSIELQ